MGQMTNLPGTDLDVVEELRIRSWARENYVPAAERDPRWHPILLDEMQQRDREAEGQLSPSNRAFSVVPLAPDELWRHHPPHELMAPHYSLGANPRVLLRIGTLDGGSR
jgi:hypothetical protein